MRVKEFISEERVKGYNYETPDIQRAVYLLNKYCTESRALLNKPIWRGMNNHQGKSIVLINTASGERQSQNTSNYYTLLQANSPYFNGWPKRNKSLICSTGEGYAEGYAYGNACLYAIFPLDGARIAVCPKRDMWETPIVIPEFKKKFIGGDDNAARFNSWLYDLGIKDGSYDALVRSAMKSIKVQWLCADHNVPVDQFIPILQKAWSPEQAGFQLLTVPEYAASKFPGTSHECWIGDNVLAIQKSLWEKFVDAAKGTV